MSCLLWPREAASGQKLNGRSRKRSHQSIGPGLQTNASWWSQYQVLSVHFVLLFWLCCMCSLGSFKWKRGTITVFQHAWHHYIAWPHDYIIHISTWTLCRASRAVSIFGIHHHGTAVQNAIWAVQPQLRWSPALHNETRKMKKKIEKVEKVSLFFHESWCIMMYHPFTISVSCHHDLHLHPSGLGHGMRILNGRWIPLHLSCWLQKSTWAVQSWACRVAESGVPVLIANKTFLWSQVQVGLKPLWENWWVQDSLKLRYSISSGLKDGWSLFNNSVMTLASNKLTWSGRAHLSALPVGNRLQDPIFPLAHRPPERSRRVRISNLNVNVCRV
jgi:hypothetical protein